jgi:hypothetical protein
MFSKIIAKVIVNSLNKRQKQLQLTENLAVLFEQDLNFKRIMLPVSEPVGWDKKAKVRLANLLSKTKDLVQSLNDNFNLYSTVSIPTPEITPIFSQPASVVIPEPVVQVQPAPVVIPEPVVQVQPAPVVIPEPVVQVQPAPIVIPEPVVQVQPTPVATTQQSALLKKFARK